MRAPRITPGLVSSLVVLGLALALGLGCGQSANKEQEIDDRGVVDTAQCSGDFDQHFERLEYEFWCLGDFEPTWLRLYPFGNYPARITSFSRPKAADPSEADQVDLHCAEESGPYLVDCRGPSDLVNPTLGSQVMLEGEIVFARAKCVRWLDVELGVRAPGIVRQERDRLRPLEQVGCK